MRTPETREHGLLQRLRFYNAFVRDLPADPHFDSRRRQVHGALYSRVQPAPVAAPRLIAYPCEVAAFLASAKPTSPRRNSRRSSAATRCSSACSLMRPT